MANVLIVDDERSIRVTIRELLRDADYEVSVAADVDSATRMMSEDDFDVVLADIIMPQITGVALLKQIKESTPRVQVILMTGEPTVETASEAVREGAFDYLSKPVRKNDLLTCVANAANVKYLEDERAKLRTENRAYRENLERLVEERTVKLLEKTRLHQEIESVAQIGSYMLDFKSGTWRSSGVLDTIFGISEDFERTVDGWISLVHPYDRRSMAEYFQDIVSGKLPRFNKEYRIVCRDDGRECWVHGLGLLVFGGDGTLINMHGTIQDITERKRIELEKEENRDRLIKTQNIAHLGFIEWDLESDEIILSDEICKIYGLTPQDTDREPDTLNKMVHPDDLEMVEQHLQKAIEGVCPMNFDHRIVRPDGEVRWVHAQSELLRNEDGEPVTLLGTCMDITERTNAEKELRLTKIAIEYSDTPAYWVAHDNRIKFVNEAAVQRLGYSRKELCSMQISDLNPVVSAGMWPDFWRRLKEAGSLTFEAEHRMKSGELFPVEIRANWFEMDGEEYSWAYVTDISEHKLAAQKLAQSEYRYRRMFEDSPISMWDEDISELVEYFGKLRANNVSDFRQYFDDNPDEIKECISRIKVLDVNQATLDLYGAAGKKELLVKLDSTFTESSFLTFKEEMIAIAEGQIHFESDAVVQTLAGERKDVRLRLSVLKPEEDGGGLRALVSTADITARKRAEAESSRLGTVVDQAGVSMFITDLDGKIVYANPYCETSTGYCVEDLIGKNPRILKSDIQDESFYKDIWETITSGNTWNGTLVNKRKNGDLYHEDATIFPIKDEHGEIINYATVKRDVSQRVRLNNERDRLLEQVREQALQERKSQQYIQQQDRLAAVGQLASGIAHDFNNFMAVIILYASMMLKTPEISTEMKKRLSVISEQARQATGLTQQILDFARRSVMESKPLDMRPFLTDLVKLFEHTLPDNIALNLRIGKGEYVIAADPSRLQQVIMNLIVNARDTMPGGGKVHIELDHVMTVRNEEPPVPGMEPGEWLRLKVIDTGSGIRPEIIDHIFEPFFTTKPIGVGTGLGLAQVYGILKQHKGFIDVSSEVDKGSTFTSYLPMSMGQREVRSAGQKQELIQGDGETILVVEDNEILRTALAESMQMLHYEVLQAGNGIEAMEILEAHEGGNSASSGNGDLSDSSGKAISLVLSDLVMPEMGGRELFDLMQERGMDIPFVVLSGNPLEEALEEMLARGVAGWMLKPPDPAELSRLVARALGKGSESAQ